MRDTSRKITIIGGTHNGDSLQWFGNRVNINGVSHVLHRVWFTDGTPRSEYYVAEGCRLILSPGSRSVRRVEVCK